MNQAQHIEVTLSRVSKQSKIDYRCRLNASIVCLRYLIRQDISNVVLKNAPDIQSDIINAVAVETTKAIIMDIENDFFSILVDECRDVSVKEQMGVVIRYVDKNGCAIERFLGLVHVSDTAATSLEMGIDSLFSTHGLSVSSLRGQGYDGASNMREMELKRPGDTRWSSHYGTLINLMHLFSSIIDVLEYVGNNGNDDAQRAEAIDLLEVMNHFEFVFVLHIMRQILGITHELSQVLQRKDQDIVNAMNLVKVEKTCLQAMRDDGWEILLKK
ncbi:uncharacterized protein LOC131007949 [Salvia miltiorrhiza]|uniref:uncharacterized protein LOC131007949 n=1 Tax=Salvia miltiorrhiza TaxID=226208 RepID=UPI0025AB76A1|nr:uncharacterized protein LOC131007949 [Salvia miltiorrhiza]